MKYLAIVPALLLLAWPAASQQMDPSPASAEEAAASPPALDGAAAARAVVESMHEVLLGCMQEAERLGFQGRFDRMVVALEEAFDFPFMARAALGATWKQLTEPQRTEFIDLSARLSATRYADNFDSYAAQRFETHSVKPAARGTILVQTELIQPDDRNVRFDYRLRKLQGRWRVIDILLDGKISELVLRRSQYRSLVERQDFPHLVQVMESKIAELSVE
jgi:phospholipid transport system substrate-binding protein